MDQWSPEAVFIPGRSSVENLSNTFTPQCYNLQVTSSSKLQIQQGKEIASSCWYPDWSSVQIDPKF